MDNGVVAKNHLEITLSNSKIINILDTERKPDQGDLSNKQGNNSQNKFDLPFFKCEACPYESIWKHAVKRHQQTHYKGQSVPEENKKFKYKCEFCTYTISNLSVLKDHQKLHTIKNRNINTDVAQNITEQKDKKHHQEHELDRMNKAAIYACKQCKFGTNYKVVLESHQKVHLPPNKGVEVYRCEQCSFNSVYRQSFLRHMKTIHDLRRDDDVLHCIYCGVASTCEEQFEQHMKVHEAERNMEGKLDHIGKKNLSSVQEKTGDYETQNNNLPDRNSKSQEVVSDYLHNTSQNTKSQEIWSDHLQNTNQNAKSQETMSGCRQNKTPTVSSNPTHAKIQKTIARTRRGKYSDVPVKTTKNGLFQCVHCSYQTAIRTALVKHQTNHLKNANS